MKKFLLLTCTACYLTVICIGCQSAKKSFKNGDFDDSVLRSIEKLKSSPGHAPTVDILRQAYPLALDRHHSKIRKARESTDIFKWEPILDSYVRLNELYRAVKNCGPCSNILAVRNFEPEEVGAREHAATVRFSEGESLLRHETREDARKAYDHFEKANSLIPNFRNAEQKMSLAYEIAVFNVVVEQVLVTSKTYQLSNEYFQDRVNEYLQINKRLNKFVRFYTPEEATEVKLRPDHVITLQFDDFIVGQMVIEKNTETVVSKDSVLVEEKFVGRSKIPVYDRVKAKFTQIRKVVHSAGLLDMQIKEFNTNKVVTQEKLDGEYNWSCEWAQFSGDERALTAAQLRKCKSQELHPPVPQELFIEFSKPIYERLTNKLQNFYAKY